MPSSSVERFVAMMGGEANLPPEIVQGAENNAPDTTHKEPAKENKDSYDNLPSVDEVIKQNQENEQAARLRRLELRDRVDSTTDVTALVLPYTQTDPGAEPSLKLGETAPKGIHFSPFLAVTKFCYNPNFVNGKWRQPFATAFFDAEKIYLRQWDIYYAWSAHYNIGKPIALIPEHQLQALINEINEAFPEANISITEEHREDGLVLDFDELPDALRPQWLGRSSFRGQYNAMMEAIPEPVMPAGRVPEERSLQAFKDKIVAAIELGKAKSKTKSKAKQQGAILRRQEMNKQVLQAQRYLGLLPNPATDDLVSAMDALTVKPIDPESPPPHPFDEDAIFIAFDVEAYERQPKVVTEVGFATLDTRDLRGAPGKDGTNWHKHIRPRHFRVVEYKHLRNHEFVEGHPDGFEYGQSEFISRADLGSALASIFREPYSKKTFTPSESTWPVIGEKVETQPEEKRKVILLGHDVGQDIAYLQNIGFSVLNRGGLLGPLDTAAMMRAYTRDPNPTALVKILYHFDQQGWRPHNAGNDAVYTMWAMLAIAVRSATERGSEEVEKKYAETLEISTAEAVEQARRRVSDESEGWRTNAHLMMAAEVASSESERPTFGPPEPPKSTLLTSGGAVLDV